MPEHGRMEYRDVAPSLEDQFANPETWQLNGDTVQVYDVWPPDAKSEVPVVIIPGWAANPQVFRENILTMAHEGRRTISVDAPHGIQAEPVAGFPNAELRKAAATVEALKEKGIEKVDAVAHSEGAINLAIAATLYPERFRNIVLVNPGGMVGEDKLGRLIVDFTSDVVVGAFERMRKEPASRKPIIRGFVEGTKTVAPHLYQSFYEEMLAINGTQIHDLLKGLKANGIGVSIIHTVDDKAFPMEKMQKMVSSEQVDGFYSVKGTHNEVYLQPEKYTKVIEQALTALEKKKR